MTITGGPKVQTSRYKAVGTDKRMYDVQNLEEKKLGSTTQTSEVKDRGNKDYQEKGLDILVKKGVDEMQTNTEIEGYGQGAMETYQTETPMFKFESASKGYEEGGHVGLDLTKDREGPIAMTYDMELGWVTEALGPTSVHWKRKAHVDQRQRKSLKPSVEKKNECLEFTHRVRSEHARSKKKESGNAGKW